MIKRLYFVLLLFIVSSCTAINIESIQEIPNRFKLQNKKIMLPEITFGLDSRYKIYSFSGKNYQALKLNNNTNGILEWIDDSGNRFMTFNGKLIRSFGLNNDFNVIYTDDFINKLYVDNASLKTNIVFENPKSGFLEIIYDYKFVKSDYIRLKESQEEIKIRLVEENFYVPKIFWKGKNYYWINEELGIVKSKQYINPGIKVHFQIIKTAE